MSGSFTEEKWSDLYPSRANDAHKPNHPTRHSRTVLDVRKKVEKPLQNPACVFKKQAKREFSRRCCYKYCSISKTKVDSPSPSSSSCHESQTTRYAHDRSRKYTHDHFSFSWYPIARPSYLSIGAATAEPNHVVDAISQRMDQYVQQAVLHFDSQPVITRQEYV